MRAIHASVRVAPVHGALSMGSAPIKVLHYDDYYYSLMHTSLGQGLLSLVDVSYNAEAMYSKKVLCPVVWG